MDRARLVGTAKEAVILAMLQHDGCLSVKDILAIANRREAAVSVPAVYRAIRLLEEQRFIAGLGTAEQDKVMEGLRQLAELGVMMPPDRGLMLFRLTATGRALGHILRLAQDGPATLKDVQQTANAVYAILAAELAAGAAVPTPAPAGAPAPSPPG
ncbi:MAG: hypothetical protein L6R48_24675 [Planctomycetes bacterium]|nr:hypothetical protein [Planctomycetota bacterium]